MDNPATGSLNLSASRGLSRWLASNRVSIAFTSYQTGQLFVVGAKEDGSVSVNQQYFERAMGLAARPGRLYLAAQSQLWRLENILRPGEVANQSFDALYVPRNAQTTGDVDIHEIGVDPEGRVILVNTSHSCLATLDIKHSFRPIWKPAFISRLAAEDRCHLNGLALGEKGEPAYVTAVSRSDIVSGWRSHRADGGVLISVAEDQIVAEGFSMPHSPRLADGCLYLLDSGRGFLVKVNPSSGSVEDIAFCPGFLRGLAIHNNHAIVTVSRPRDGSFAGLALEAELSSRNAEAWCGVLFIDLANGNIVEWIRFSGLINELFDVVAMPGVKCPIAMGPGTAEIQQTISFDPEIRPLVPEEH